MVGCDHPFPSHFNLYKHHPHAAVTPHLDATMEDIVDIDAFLGIDTGCPNE